jgi:hypothetical protein
MILSNCPYRVLRASDVVSSLLHVAVWEKNALAKDHLIGETFISLAGR